MPFAFSAAMVCTVVLMVTNAYFLMGSMPLLTLRHDTPLDARFIRAFYATYYFSRSTRPYLPPSATPSWGGHISQWAPAHWQLLPLPYRGLFLKEWT